MTIINVYISGRTWNGKEHHIPRHHNEKRYKPNNHQPGLLRSCWSMPRTGLKQIKTMLSNKITNLFNTIRVIIITKLRYWNTWQKSAVQVSNVLYKNIQGTSSRPIAVKFVCSKNIPCRGISMQNVKLVDQTQQDVSKASCSNVKLDTRGNVSPLCTWSLLIPKKKKQYSPIDFSLFLYVFVIWSWFLYI